MLGRKGEKGGWVIFKENPTGGLGVGKGKIPYEDAISPPIGWISRSVFWLVERPVYSVHTAGSLDYMFQSTSDHSVGRRSNWYHFNSYTWLSGSQLHRYIVHFKLILGRYMIQNKVIVDLSFNIKISRKMFL